VRAPMPRDAAVPVLAVAPQPQPGVERKKPEEPKKDEPKPEGPKERLTLETDTNVSFPLAFSADGNIMFASDLNDIAAWNLKTGKREYVLRFGQGSVSDSQVALAPDGKTLAALSRDGVRVWELKNQEMTVEVKWPQQTRDPDTGEAKGVRLMSAALAANGSRAASITSDGKINVWNLATGKSVVSFAAGKRDLGAIALSPDGKTLATPAPEGGIALWDADTGKEQKTLEAKERVPFAVRELRFSGDGKVLTDSTGNGLRFWDLSTGKVVKTLNDRTTTGRHNTLSPDGKTLAVCPPHDKKLTLVDVATGKERVTFHWVSWPGSAVFSPDGKLIASGRQGRIRVWDVPPPEEKSEK
jgi:WD40 repeat protein